MGRIRGVAEAEAGPVLRWIYRLARKQVGQVPEPLTVAARHRQIFRAYAGYEFWLGKARLVEPRLKCLAGQRAATLIGCPF